MEPRSDPPTLMRVANAPVSWGIIEFDLGGPSMAAGQVLDEIAQTGYQGTELGDWGFLPTDPPSLRDELEARQLELVAAFVPVAFADPNAHPAGEAQALQVARLLSAVAGERPLIVLSDDNASLPERERNAGRIGAAQLLSPDQWRVFSAGVERIARAVRNETGLRSVYHHHGGGFVETPEELGVLMERTDPQLVGLCLDSGHYRFGGGDPVAAIRQYGDRVWHVHLKDWDPAVAAQAARAGWGYLEAVRHGVFCRLGRGAVDFAGLLGQLRAIDYAGWLVVEQDLPAGQGDPQAFAQQNREYLRSLGV